ncbi:MAG TPA: hypothetical protein P5138_02885 [Solirubrobacterales bacterium]|nr:hypothetical protein [Solirubrobacterales bacterium]
MMFSAMRRMSTGRLTGSVVAAVAITVSLFMVESPAEARWKQPGCTKFSKQIRTANTPAAKRAARKRLAKCKVNRRVYGILKNKMIAGTRADGVYVDSVYCANGSFSYDGGESFVKKGWRVENARIRGRNITAIVRGKIKGGSYVTAVARRGSQWKVGWESFGQARDLGDAELTNARALCRKA